MATLYAGFEVRDNGTRRKLTLCPDCCEKAGASVQILNEHGTINVAWGDAPHCYECHNELEIFRHES